MAMYMGHRRLKASHRLETEVPAKTTNGPSAALGWMTSLNHGKPDRTQAAAL
jgi:hypothetical protein